MIRALLALALIAPFVFATRSFAQGNSGAKLDDVKAEAVPEKTNKVDDDEDPDDIITNKLLRAESGSKSKWSIASQINYNGSSVDKPLDEDRPNITHQTGATPKSDIEGQISAKYNLNARNALLAGTGIRWIAPLQGGPHNYNGTTYDAYDPYLTYQYLYKFWGVEAVLQISETYFTESNLVEEGYVQQFNIDQENMKKIGNTHLSIGASTWLQYQSFNKSGPTDDFDDVREDQSDYAFGLFPELEYEFNDTFNFRAIFGLWSYEHKRDEPRFNSYFLDEDYVSLGLGISVTRDIYLFPVVEFLPEHISADQTNVALQATVNLF